jgi:hypothetical protein
MPAQIPGESNGGRELRRARASQKCELEMSNEDTKRAHRRDIDGVEEELHLLEHTFYDDLHGLLHFNPQYTSWFKTVDSGFAYHELNVMLRYLQWQFHSGDSGGSDRPWLLKAPMNLGNERHLAQAFPTGIQLVFCHRDPKHVLGSVCHLVQAARSLYYRETDKTALGPFLLDWFAHKMEKSLDWLQCAPDQSVLHLSYREIEANSIGTASKVFGFLGEDFGDEHVRRATEWEREDQRVPHGGVTYALEEFGLTGDQVDQVFGRYRETFGSYF